MNSNFQYHSLYLKKYNYKKEIEQFEENMANAEKSKNLNDIIKQKHLYNDFVTSKCSEFANPFNT
jgi:hypothetical protein